MALLLTEGLDTYCLDSLEPGRMATGVDLVAQRCYHRLITPRGRLRGGEEEADFGMDLAGFIGSTEDSALKSMLPVRVQNELLKDPTVDSVKVIANRTESGGRISWDLTVKVQSAVGPFDLILAVDDLTVELIEVRS